MKEEEKQKDCVMGVVYPLVKPFLKKYFESLSLQDNLDFDLVIFDDQLGLNEEELQAQYPQLNIVIIAMPKEGNVATKRKWALEEIKKRNYRKVMFTDCDDHYYPSRVRKSFSALDEVTIVFNDFTLINKEGEIIKESIYKSRNIVEKDAEDVLKYNLIGFSNSGINLSNISFIPEIQEEIIAVDWLLYSFLILQNKVKVSYIDEALTYYRKYDNNFGFEKEINQKYLQKNHQTKKIHYDELLKIIENSEIQKKIKEKKELLDIAIKRSEDGDYLQKHIEETNKEDKYFLWQEVL